MVQGVKEIADSAVPKALKPITRMADSVDVRRMRQNRGRKARLPHLPGVHRPPRAGNEAGGGPNTPSTAPRSCFYFTADGRVDFRELVKDLAASSTPHRAAPDRCARREQDDRRSGHLRPALLLQPLPERLSAVSIKMAKEQGPFPHPTKISGACGRLMCCLAYEESAYEYLNSIMPMVGSTVRSPDGLGTVARGSTPSPAICGCAAAPRPSRPGTIR